MEWSILFELIEPALIVVVAVCWAIGIILKKTPRILDWTIVYIVTAIAVLLVVWLHGFSPESIIQGVLCGAFAVYGHQVFKQTKESIGQ